MCKTFEDDSALGSDLLNQLSIAKGWLVVLHAELQEKDEQIMALEDSEKTPISCCRTPNEEHRRPAGKECG